MNTRKPLIAAGLIVAMSFGSVGIAVASTHTMHPASKATNHFASSNMPMLGHVDPLTHVLAALVTAGTITQAQSDAITAALKAAMPVKPSIGGGAGGPGENDGPDIGGRGMGINFKNDLTIITTTLGVTTAQLRTDFAAGQSLSTIAGAKTASLITALVASETTNINAKVTAGKITQAQATSLIAGLTAAVTAAVNAAPGMGGMGHHGHHGPLGLPGGASTPSVTPPAGANN